MKEYFPQQQFSSPEEEIAFLRAQIAEREREILQDTGEQHQPKIESVAVHQLQEYSAFTPRSVLSPQLVMPHEDIRTRAESVVESEDPIKQVLDIVTEKGVYNALSVIEKFNNPYLIDEAHRALVSFIRNGAQVQDLREDVPPWHILHLTLFEVTLPELKNAEDREYQLAELVGMMEQLFSGLQTIGSRQKHNHFAMEIAIADKSDDIIFYVAIPQNFISLFEKLTLSLFPHAILTEQKNDYNIFVPDGTTLIADVTLKRHHIYPIATDEVFSVDPLVVVLNAFSKIDREGGGAAIQFIVRHPQQSYLKGYEDIVKRIQKGMRVKEAISRSTLGGEVLAEIYSFFDTSKKIDTHTIPEQGVEIELFNKKKSSPIVETNIRIAVSASTQWRAEQIIDEISATLNQFSVVGGNEFKFHIHRNGSALRSAEKAFSFREMNPKTITPLSLKELATMMHFPANGIRSSPQFKQSHAVTAAAQIEMPISGTLLGVNIHRGTERNIFVSEKDRMRHFYVIGQTGTGKSVFLQNLIVQDIVAGNGVCMIDPHGTDIEEVLGAIPKERANDVIYFDPANLERPIGLNMLEYDRTKPEQKTFVVNELFSIFQKLYGANPESMGPMFEQYFRNATLLVMEDPDSGNTLMDISRVMADAKYRRMKLEKAQNPVVVQFWREIASKAGGEASLENIVPYIVSKFDVFTANDYMRPIIGQQQSTFNFRSIMDERKILLVNLSKGRLGEINANLIGMIIVGKILMAALSRVDDPTKQFPPFYLHIDEFQNISTPAIASILSEARKYKLSLTMAHQYIAQLDSAIRDAVFGNVGSIACFRVGTEDAQFMEQQFAPIFNTNNIINIPNWNAYFRVLADGVPAKPFSAATLPPPVSDPELAAAIKQHSLSVYGRPRAEVENEIADRYKKDISPLKSIV
jgi:hypothetical protein